MVKRSPRQVHRYRHECDLEKSWPKASSRKARGTLDDNSFNQKAGGVPDRYTYTDMPVIKQN
jgi:hypothetical protein